MGSTWRVASVASCTRRLVKKGSTPTKRASGRSRTNVAKATLISWLVVALSTWICSPIARAAVCTSRDMVSSKSESKLSGARVSQSFSRFSPLVHCPESCGHYTHQAESEEWRLLHHEQESAFINCDDGRWLDGARCCISRAPIHQRHLADDTARRNGLVNIVAIENLETTRLTTYMRCPGSPFSNKASPGASEMTSVSFANKPEKSSLIFTFQSAAVTPSRRGFRYSFVSGA